MKARKMPRDKAAEQLNEFKRTQRVSDGVTDNDMRGIIRLDLCIVNNNKFNI